LPAVRYKGFAVASPVVPAGQLVEYEAGHVEAPHSHVESELFFVVSGTLTIGDEQLGEGMLAHIPGGTVYGPSVAGAGGVRFLRLHLEG
jgi:mannose-6-phosphate isomerase-like protein (cupin superfamily)